MIELCCEYLSVRCIWLYVIIMSRSSFRVNPHSIVCLNVKELLARSRRHIWSLSDSNVIRTHNNLIRKETLNHFNQCGFTLKLVRDMIITYSQMHHTHNIWPISITWPVWLNSWVFVYKLSGCGFESCCCHLNFRYGACFKQAVPWHSGKL